MIVPHFSAHTGRLVYNSGPTNMYIIVLFFSPADLCIILALPTCVSFSENWSLIEKCFLLSENLEKNSTFRKCVVTQHQ